MYRYKLLAAIGLTLAAILVPAQAQRQLPQLPGFRNSPKLDTTWRMSIHNAFWDGAYVTGYGDAGSGGPNQHILDDLFIDRARGIEFDVHADHGQHVFK